MTTSHSSAADPAAAEKLKQAALNASFTGFFTRNYDSVLRILGRSEYDKGMVEDVAQEAFVAVRDRWAEVQSYQKPAAYLMKVAFNKLCDHQERRGRTSTIYIDLGDMPDVAPPETPAEADDLLAGWIQLLPAQQGRVISLTLDNYPDLEIAHILGISCNTVREYKVKAKQKLQQLAEADGFITPAGRRRR
ncbi:RNA polymerase sigma factor [Symbioplanes lichenis]|uniref:RNA polymerase sigma factor n=1 Tax=Symbioplanes lichenis TaxID=1629072 RepID=UPI002738F092|nr:sigma-70 family RNA polymerase sigma factor [Actinoplanes lichenis]